MPATLLLGDCLERMAEIEDGSVDLILTSPPYDGLRKYADGSAFDFEGLASECFRALKVGGVLVWVVNDETRDGSESGTSFRQALHFKSIGFRLHDTMIYAKKNYVPLTHNRYEQAFEFMFVLAKGKPKTFNPFREPCAHAGKVMPTSSHYIDGETLSTKNGANRPIKPTKLRSNIWSYSVGGKTFDHPAMFPLQLAIDHVLSWTNHGDTVVDPFAGSGTTLEACLKTDRNGIGIEKSPTYFAIAEKRIREAENASPLFANVSA